MVETDETTEDVVQRDPREGLAWLSLAVFVLAGTSAGFAASAESDLWLGLGSLSLTSLVACWFLGAE